MASKKGASCMGLCLQIEEEKGGTEVMKCKEPESLMEFQGNYSKVKAHCFCISGTGVEICQKSMKESRHML
eukprot:Gb_02771 [translate_table: standard]